MIETWLSRPGTASTLIPNEGIDQEWRTSVDVIIKRIWVLKGKIIRLSTSIRRNSSLSKLFVDFIYESNSTFKKSEYSYDQYHWWPTILIVNSGLFTSSNKYNKRKEGRAIKINVIAGSNVQINSINCPSNNKRLIILFKNKVLIIYPTITVIIMRITKVWSWKKISCSMRGDIASWRLIFDQFEISNKKIIFIYES